IRGGNLFVLQLIQVFNGVTDKFCTILPLFPDYCRRHISISYVYSGSVCLHSNGGIVIDKQGNSVFFCQLPELECFFKEDFLRTVLFTQLDQVHTSQNSLFSYVQKISPITVCFRDNEIQLIGKLPERNHCFSIL